MNNLSSFVNLQSPDISDAGPKTDYFHYRLLPKSMLDSLSFKSNSNKKEKLNTFKSRSPLNR